MDAALIRGLEALKRDIELTEALTETGTFGRCIKSGSTKWNIVK